MTPCESEMQTANPNRPRCAVSSWPSGHPLHGVTRRAAGRALTMAPADRRLWQSDDSDGIGTPGIDAPGIYAIYFCAEIVYIGSTANIQNRLSEHLRSYAIVLHGRMTRRSRMDHYLYGAFLGSTRLPDVLPLTFKYCFDASPRRTRYTREMALIKRLQPRLNKAGIGSRATA